MNEKVFQGILDQLTPLLPNEWVRLIYRADYSDGSYSMKFYVETDDERFIDCFSLKSASKQQVLSSFRSINKIIAPERASTSDKEKWSVMTMVINQAGKFKTDFDYTDISKNMVSYQEEWEKKYLGK